MIRTSALFKCTLAAIIAFGAIGDSSGAQAKRNVVCESVSVLTSIQEVSGRHKLLITVTNPTAKPVELVQFYFGENMLRLDAVVTPGGKDLRRVIPLLSPGVKNAVIKPGAAFLREIDLDVVFPDLEAALATTDVLVSWELQIKLTDACFTQKIATSMMLRTRN